MKTITRVFALVLTALVVGKFYFQLPCFAVAAAQHGANMLRARRDCNSCGQECSVLCRVPDRRWKFCCMNYVRKKRGYFNPFSQRTMDRSNFPAWPFHDDLWDPASEISELPSSVNVNLLPDLNSHLNSQNGYGSIPGAAALKREANFDKESDGTADSRES